MPEPCYLFLDESGQVDGGSHKDLYRDYLGLYGCAIWHESFVDTVEPMVDEFKATHFPDHPPRDLCLHRRDIIHKAGPFAVLWESGKEVAFNTGLLEILRAMPYRSFAFVVHKTATHRPPRTPYRDPYHFGLALLLERFARFVTLRNGRGVVVAESRGPDEDRRLKAAYESIRTNGTSFHTPAHFSVLGAQIKFRRKLPAVAGLELADLCAQPAKLDVLADYDRAPAPAGFAAQIREVLAEKYNRRMATGQVRGYGKRLYTWPNDAAPAG